jgi:uncharacterized protein (DUF58 family)
MRTAFAYTTARILMFAVAVIMLYLAGARGLLLLGLALVISALASYILLSKQRQVMAERLNGRLGRAGGRLSKVGAKATEKATEFRERLEEGTKAEDDAVFPGSDPRTPEGPARTPGEPAR